MKKKSEFKIQTITHRTKLLAHYNDPLLQELVARLRENRTQFLNEWARRITDNGADVTLIAAAISEVARNVVDHAQRGEIVMSPLNSVAGGGKSGIQIVARDEGPGIRGVAQAMQYGYSTRKGLGVGLPGAKWLMDEFDIASEVGRGHKQMLKRPLEAAGRNRDGNEFALEITRAAWRTRAGIFFTGVLRDIRERKQAEAALRESREHYIQLFQEVRAMEENLRQLSNRVLTDNGEFVIESLPKRGTTVRVQIALSRSAPTPVDRETPALSAAN